jgi:hypothetical protein
MSLGVVLAVSAGELDVLIQHWEVEANRWGVNNGVVESPERYELAVYRLRHLTEIRDKVNSVREELRADIDTPLTETDIAATAAP